ncbi:MAG: NifB/NifX family molybdenum-iron cluster-binding protein [Deltaproteobacteria bacterium]|nr:NifB/NifX family molybdenum-iron cluster-binding protein [Deltaproteobacteria bacterium]
MRIAISSTGPSLDSAVDPRFGRCQFFVIVNLDNMDFEAVPNASNTLEGGAGIQAAKVMVDRGAEIILTGYIGPNAEQVLSTAGLNAITGVSGTVREVAQRYREGKLKPVGEGGVRIDKDPGRTQSFSQTTGPFQASAPRVGLGRGMGGGRGRGRGGGGQGRG